MACHHGVEGPCMVCERVAYKKANPAPVQVVLLHLEARSGKSLCGLPGEECLFSSTTAHDEERFCRQCLRAQRKREPRKLIPISWRNRSPVLVLLALAVSLIAGTLAVAITYKTAGFWPAFATVVLFLLFWLDDGPRKPPRS